jgi:NADH-quinone oxidoreductase subunit E
MSVRRLAAEQPEGFAFTPENLEWAKAQIKKYPEGRQASAVLPILWRAQEQMGGWLPEPALRYVADMLGMAYIRVYEIATFYTMFNLAPVGRYYVQVCGTTPCWLRGADEIKHTCRKLIGEPGHVTPDGLFSWTEVECLGACVNAPMAQINKDYYEDLTPESLEWILMNLKAGREVEPGPQNGRQASAPLGGPTTLTDPELYRNEEPEEEDALFGATLTDREAKRRGRGASQREAAVPKPPLGSGRKTRSK